jgi:hypothetical protein
MGGPPVPGPLGLPPQPPQKRHHRIRNALAIVVGAFFLLIIAGIALAGLTGGNKPAHHATPSAHSKSSQPAPVVIPVPEASPDGHGTMTCDVSLSMSLYGKSHLIADIRYRNTGNIGTVTRVVMKWPQEGYGPLTMARTVRLGAGASKVLHFHRAASTEEVDRFQNVQLATNGNPCDFSLNVVSTFGTAGP